MNESRRRSGPFVAGVIILLLVAVGAVYAPVRDHEFVNYDDDLYVTGNPRVLAGVSPSGLRWAWTTFHAANWHPLTWISHMIDVELFGERATGHHLSSVAWHALNCILLFLLLRRASGCSVRSGLVALVFAVHPLHVESVAWISERKDVLSACLGLLAFLVYVRYTREGGTWRYLSVTALLALSLTAKPTLVTFPLLALLLDFWPLGRTRTVAPRRLIVEKLPWLALSAASSAVTLVAQARGGAMGDLARYPLAGRSLNAMYAYAVYLWKTIWPVGLALPYPYASAGSAGGRAAIAAATLVFVTVGVISLRRRAPYLSFGWAWFFVSLIPMIGVVQVGEQAMADRYMYLPLIGPAVMFVWGTADVAAALRSHRGATAVRIAGASAMTVMLVALTVRARDQVGYWRNSVTLFEHTLAVTPDNYNAHLNLGLALTERGELEGAIGQLTEVTRLRPDLASGYYNLGIALDRLGRVDEAGTAFRAAIDRDPTDARAYNNLGRVLVSRGRLGEADARLELAIRLDPDFAEAYYNRGTVLAMQRDWSAAERLLARAVELRPDYAIAHYNHALVLEQLGREQDARRAFERAERYGYRGPGSPQREVGP